MKIDMQRRHLFVLAVIMAWVLLGPIGMAFSGCGAMGDGCEGPCAVLAALVSAAPSVSVLLLIAAFGVPVPGVIPRVQLQVLEPPPKFVSLSS